MIQSLNFERTDQVVMTLKAMAPKAFADAQAMDQTEQQLFRELLALGHSLVGSIPQAAGDGDLAQTTEKNGRMHRRLPKRRRRSRSIFAEFQIKRYLFGNDPERIEQRLGKSAALVLDNPPSVDRDAEDKVKKIFGCS